MKHARAKALPALLGATFGVLLAVLVARLLNPPVSELTAHRLRAALALGALVLVSVERRVRPPAWVSRAVAAALCPLALAAYFAFLSPFDARLLHRHDLFHYYLGAKYPRELAYTRIYACTALAQSELGQGKEVRARTIRVLADDSVAAGAAVLAAAGSECRPHFSAPRWTEFVRDVRLLRENTPRETWDDIQLDHGFNATPAWLLAGHPLASLHAPTPGFLLWLTRIDVVLVLATGVAVGWAFRLRTLAVFAVFLGCQAPGAREWLGGSFLRFDWTFAAVLGVAALAKRRPALAGAALATAAALRLFPAVLLLGPLLAIVARALRERRLQSSARRLLAATTFTLAAEVAVATVAYGPSTWRDFAAHIRVHEMQRGVNSMGFGFVLEHDVFHADALSRADAARRPDFGLAWASLHQERARALGPWRLLAALAATALVFRARRRPLWVTSILSLAVLGFGTVLSCYYWVVFGAWALLARVVRRAERLVLGTVFAAELVVTMPAFSARLDDVYALQSVIYLTMAGTLLAWLTVPRKPSRGPSAS
jgi:hypothetical protein